MWDTMARRSWIPAFLFLIIVAASSALPAEAETTYYCYGSTHQYKGDCGEDCTVYFAIFDKNDTKVKENSGGRLAWVQLVWDVTPDTGCKVKCRRYCQMLCMRLLLNASSRPHLSA